MDEDLTYSIDDSLSDVTQGRCPVLYALSIIGQKWKLPIIWYLHENEFTRYNELKRRIPGITGVMLAKSLRELEEDGLVNRHDRQTNPPHVEYSLSSSGMALLPALNELYHWGENRMSSEQDDEPVEAQAD
ncbi:MAG: helix-turn-helix domain-containing protein [Actinomyces urogenitalis]|uniref:winged helix-turn-helix transcriptional regulator n=1 Tax=Actinomyces urogenitalis TaxID=103621 RepID=UPI002A80AC36|nr:helix-turn-helix domain-containing protein [Actinomyces urogenitalis]MDY3678239.1 helix-turn-helix domain-containing protein [Actinomyces urogenitalis]